MSREQLKAKLLLMGFVPQSSKYCLYVDDRLTIRVIFNLHNIQIGHRLEGSAPYLFTQLYKGSEEHLAWEHTLRVLEEKPWEAPQ